MAKSGFWCPRAAWLALGMVSMDAASAPQGELCKHPPRYSWVSAGEVEERLKSAGFKLLRLRISNEACYVALVMNSGGQKLEMRLHPASSEILDIDNIPVRRP